MLGRFGQTEAGRALQNALNVLATVVNDPQLGVTVDGKIGPATAKAYNRAAKMYLSTAPAKGRTGKLSVSIVRQYAPRFVGFIQAELEKRQAKPLVEAVKPAPPPPKPEPEPKKAAPAKTAAGRTLQTALRALGSRTNDKGLMVAVDGIIGPATAKATNQALTRYGAAAPSELRTGELSVSQIRALAPQIAAILEEAAREAKPKPEAPAPAQAPARADVQALQKALRTLGEMTNNAVLKIAVDGIIGPRTASATSTAIGRKVSPSDVRGNLAALTAQVQQIVQQTRTAQPPPEAAPPTPMTPPDAGPVPSPAATPRLAVARLQRALADLGAVMGDSVLQIRSDGIAGPRTAAALNKALANYVRDKPASLRQRFSPAQIAVMADALTTQIESELARRRAEISKKEAAPPAPPTPTPPPEPAPPLPVPAPPTPVSPVAPAPPSPSPLPSDEKKVPWGWIAGVGGAALVVGGLMVAAFSSRRARREAAA